GGCRSGRSTWVTWPRGAGGCCVPPSSGASCGRPAAAGRTGEVTALHDGARIETLADAHRLQAGGERRFHSATHEEIAAGATSDVYFVKTMDILRHLGRAETPVVAEVFASRAGVLAGIQEAR